MSGEHVAILDITKEPDFTRKRTIDDVICSIRGVGDVFFYGSPCTGGSSWQNLNIELAGRKEWQQTIVNLIGHWDVHRRLWQGFEIVVRHCAKVGATVLLEWPRYCAYWREPKVSSFLREMNFRFANFDGCMYGLVSTRKSGNYPLRKPWRIAYINSTIADHLNLTCDGSHMHVPGSGPDAKCLQGYSP